MEDSKNEDGNLIDQNEEDEKNQKVVNDLITRAKKLLSELEEFRTRLRDLRQEGSVELAHFRGVVSSEVSMLERLSSRPSTNASAHVARSSNLPFLETVWGNAKKSRDLVALQKRIYFNLNSHGPPPDGNSETSIKSRNGRRGRKKGDKDGAVIVDSITEVFDLAKQGWDSGGSSDEGDFVNFAAQEDDDDRDIPLLKTTKDLTKAAKQIRVRTRQPLVQLILPRIELGVTTEVDNIIEECRACGVVVFCGEDLTPEPELKDALQAIAPDPMKSFSHIVNIDCTILLAVVSDFSHARVSKETWFHRALQRQVEIEDNENLLPSLLYPALRNHDMVCTEEAAKRMREIVDTIGTPSEKARTALLMGDDQSKSMKELIDEMQQWSAYEVPGSWRLPIRAVIKNENDCLSSLPAEATAISEDLTAINQSVFLHGWATGRTTITSNRIVVRQIEKKLDEYSDLDDSVWPKIWLCPTARSLVGKEKRGAKKEEKKEGAWPLPDPLRREHQRRNGLDVLSQREGREVEDMRPDGYPSEDVIAAKLKSQRLEGDSHKNGAAVEHGVEVEK